MGNGLSNGKKQKIIKRKKRINPEKKEDKKKQEELYYEENKIEDKNLLINLHLLIKNLEAQNVNPEEIKEKLKFLFKDLIEKKENEFNEDNIKNAVICVFIDYLKPINQNNINFISEIINLIFEKNINPKEIYNYLIEILENVNKYYKMEKEDEDKIYDYIISKLEDNKTLQNKKDEIRNKYIANSNIIKYEEFVHIIKDNNIYLENLAMEYLLYKMKLGLPLDKDNYMDDLNFKIFLDLFNKKNKIKI